MQEVLQHPLEGLAKLASGKVRDLYLVDGDLLLVASDRISAFDHVLGSEIPDKGTILTQLSLFWFEFLEHTVPNHIIQSEVDAYPEALAPFRQDLRGRSMLVKRAEMFPVECVVRGYLSGSGWKDYGESGSLCGIALPAGLEQSSRLPEPLFTPASKSQLGEHDENISFAEMCARIGREDAETLRRLSLEIYDRAARHADECGLILADTKFEFGRVGDVILLADEVLTPDSSRFWSKAEYAPGGAQASFDKQFVREYLEESGWNKQAPAPALPREIIERTREKYLEAFRLLTGTPLAL